MQKRRDGRTVHTSAHRHGHGIRRRYRLARTSGFELGQRGHFYRCLLLSYRGCAHVQRRKRAQALHHRRNYADRFVDLLLRRRPPQAETQTRSRLVRRQPNRGQHVRRFHRARRTRRARRTHHALQVQRDHQRFSASGFERKIRSIRCAPAHAAIHSHAGKRQQRIFKPVAQRSQPRRVRIQIFHRELRGFSQAHDPRHVLRPRSRS